MSLYEIMKTHQLKADRYGVEIIVGHICIVIVSIQILETQLHIYVYDVEKYSIKSICSYSQSQFECFYPDICLV